MLVKMPKYDSSCDTRDEAAPWLGIKQFNTVHPVSFGADHGAGKSLSSAERERRCHTVNHHTLGLNVFVVLPTTEIRHCATFIRHSFHSAHLHCGISKMMTSSSRLMIPDIGSSGPALSHILPFADALRCHMPLVQYTTLPSIHYGYIPYCCVFCDVKWVFYSTVTFLSFFFFSPQYIVSANWE